MPAQELPQGMMWERRPLYLQQAINDKSNKVTIKDAVGSWKCRGETGDYDFLTLGGSVIEWLSGSGSDIARGHVVDYGAYRGINLASIKMGGGFEQATAVGLAEPSNVPRVIAYEKGDLQAPEVYSRIVPAADLAVSQMALVHCLDPLAAMELMANNMNLNGVLIVQYSSVYEDLLQPANLRQILQNAGLEVGEPLPDDRFERRTRGTAHDRMLVEAQNY